VDATKDRLQIFIILWKVLKKLGEILVSRYSYSKMLQIFKKSQLNSKKDWANI